MKSSSELVLHGFAVVDADSRVANAEPRRAAIPDLDADGSVFGLPICANTPDVHRRPPNNTHAAGVREICDVSPPRSHDETGCGIVMRDTGSNRQNRVLGSERRLLRLAAANDSSPSGRYTLLATGSARLH